MAGVLEGTSKMVLAISLSLGELGELHALDLIRVVRRIRRREAKVSDVGGKDVGFDLCHVICTAIAEIKGFRFRLKRIILDQRNRQ
jgi:hypothetical protein